MIKKIILCILICVSHVAFSKDLFTEAFKKTLEIRKNYRAASYNASILRKQIELSKDSKEIENLTSLLQYYDEQEKESDRTYSEAISGLLNIIRTYKKRDDLINILYKVIETEQTAILANLHIEKSEKLLGRAGRISLASYLLQNVYSNETLSHEDDIETTYVFLMEERFVFFIARHLTQDPKEQNLFTEEIKRVDQEIEDLTKDANLHVLKSKNAMFVNSTIHSILALSGLYPSTFDYSRLASRLLYSDDNRPESVNSALQVINKHWASIREKRNYDLLEYQGQATYKPEKKFLRKQTNYIRIENIDLLESIYLPMNTIDEIIDRVSKDFLYLMEDLYEEKRQKKLPILPLEQVVYFSKHRPQKLTKSEKFPLYTDKGFMKKASEMNLLHPFGPWTIFISDDYYVEIADGLRDSGYLNSKTRPSDTYDAMRHEVNLKSFVKKVRAFLENGGQDPQLNESNFNEARLTYAKFISEPARNFSTWLINLMLLDLIEEGVINNVDDFFDLHPMRGGSYANQVAGGGGKKRGQIVNDETLIVVNWLRHFWPRSEAISFVDEIDSDYFKVIENKSSTEEYYFNLIIQILCHRLKGTQRFDPSSFIPDDNVRNDIDTKLPRRLLRKTLQKDLLTAVHGDREKFQKISKLYDDFWDQSDSKAIHGHVLEMLTSISASSLELSDFWRRKHITFEESRFVKERPKFLEILNEISDLKKNSAYNDFIIHSLRINAPRELFALEEDGRQTIYDETIAPTENNDCGFAVLGIPRVAAIQQLLEQAANLDIRHLVADDIVAALLSGDLPAEMVNEETRNLQAFYELYNHLVNRNPEYEDRIAETNHAIREYAMRQETYENFVRYYLGIHSEQLSYVRDGHGLLDAIAELNGLEVNVWANPQGNSLSNEVTRIHRYTPHAHPPIRQVHMHHTWGMTHFNHMNPIDTTNLEDEGLLGLRYLFQETPTTFSPHAIFLMALFEIHFKDL